MFCLIKLIIILLLSHSRILQKWSPHFFVLINDKLSFTEQEEKEEDEEVVEELEVQHAVCVCVLRDMSSTVE